MRDKAGKIIISHDKYPKGLGLRKVGGKDRVTEGTPSKKDSKLRASVDKSQEMLWAEG